jgi:hypothetical protein
MGAEQEPSNLHKKIGLVFAGFCALLIVWHLMTPENPDHVLNLAMHSALTILFVASALVQERPGFVVQIVALSLGAVVTGSVGSYHAAGFVGGVAILMYYATGGFITLGVVQTVAVSGLQLANIAFSASMAGKDFPQALGHSAVGSAATMAALWAFWRLCLVWSKSVIVQNRELLEILKERECKDGPRT